MSKFFPYDLFSLYGELLNPFRNKEFGPELATLLLILALFVLVGFLCLAVPQAFRLRAALMTIKRGSQGEREADRYFGFSNNYETIDRALSSNKATATAWREFRKCLVRRGNSERTTFFNSVPSNIFFNTRNGLPVGGDQRCTLRNEVLNTEWFVTTRQAQTVINQWLRQYNHIRPHQALGMRPPVPETILVNHQITGTERGG